MRLIRMTGGLGNQMFIYAFYLRMRKDYPEVRIDLSEMKHYKVHHGYELHRLFDLPHNEFCIPKALKKVMAFLFFRKLHDRNYSGGTDWAYRKPYKWPLLYFTGYFQSEMYFADIADEIRRTFRFKPELFNDQSRQLVAKIDADPNAVSLHIRRGDYVLPKNQKMFGSVCTLPYYQRAIRQMRDHVSQPSFYVFSDDIAWVKENIPLENAHYVDWNHGTESWQDMMLMSHCRHHIICNSTFSWWGAWLNPRRDKVVLMPNRWFQTRETPDVYPEGWIRVPVDAQTD